MNTYIIMAVVLTAATAIISIVISVYGHTWLSEAGSCWMPRTQRWRFHSRFRKSGLALDGGSRRISEKDSWCHASCISPSGSGKSSIYALGNLLTADGKSSYIALDASDELRPQSSGWLHYEMGYSIAVLNVANVSQSQRWNPLARCRSHSDLQKIATTLVDASLDHGSSGSQSFWNTSAKDLLTTLLRCLMNCEEKYRTIANLRFLLNYVGDESLDGFVLRTADAQTWSDYMGVRRYSEKVLLSIVATCRAAVQPWADPELVRLTSSDTLEFDKLRTTPTILYISVPESEMSYWGFFTSILYGQLFEFLSKPEKSGEPFLGVYAILDEFGNTAPIINCASHLTSLRKRKVSLSILTQDVSQIESKYGRAEATTILSSCATRIYLPGMSQAMCESVSKELGQETIEITENGRVHREKRPLLSPDEVRTMPSNRAICISSNKRPILLHTRPFYRSRKLKRRSRIAPPPIPVAENIEPAYIDLQRMAESPRPLPALPSGPDNVSGNRVRV